MYRIEWDIHFVEFELIVKNETFISWSLNIIMHTANNLVK